MAPTLPSSHQADALVPPSQPARLHIPTSGSVRGAPFVSVWHERLSFYTMRIVSAGRLRPVLHGRSGVAVWHGYRAQRLAVITAAKRGRPRKLGTAVDETSTETPGEPTKARRGRKPKSGASEPEDGTPTPAAGNETRSM